ncbi:MAG: glycine zipper 2TM domain-containing protein, partial [Candidatus Eremiobacteraeota bacterium]|nr:glycine zipper 2TM domain-containing protein [Candidatus Eremiobacteraeota bacterium]
MPDKVFLRAPLQTLAGASVGGLAGALLSSHHLLGAVIGAAAGGLVGNYADIMAYDAAVMARQLKNRLVAERGKWWHKVDEARQPDPPAPLTNQDLRAVAPTGDSQRRYDGYDSSRDLYSLHSREGDPDQPYR